MISQKKDYSVRAEKFQRDDEIGVLIDGFNEMLTEIQSQQSELKDHREHLEELVRETDPRPEGIRNGLQESQGGGRDRKPGQKRIPWPICPMRSGRP